MLDAINALAELELIGWKLEHLPGDEVRCKCPFHDDRTPSCSINVAKNVFKCHAANCGKQGDIITLLAGMLKTTRRVVFEDLSTRYSLESQKTIDLKLVEQYHQAIWQSGPLLTALKVRGITDAIIRKHRLGRYGNRITIPIFNRQGACVNIRRYLPGATQKVKMRHTRGYEKRILYPVNQLSYDTIVICGGEIKALVAASLLNQHDIGAVSSLLGEGNWAKEFTKQFDGKQTYVCLDVDDAGKTAATVICTRIYAAARWVGKVELPLSLEKYPTGDINDWVGKEGATATDFLQLLQATSEWTPPDFNALDENEEPKNIDLGKAVDAVNTGKRLKVRAIISAVDTSPYVVPKTMMVTCDRGQDCCAICPMFSKKCDDAGACEVTVNPESAAILEMVAAPKRLQRAAIMNGLSIPPCKSVTFVPHAWYNVEDVRLGAQLKIADRSSSPVMLPSLCIGYGIEANESYELTGRMYPHPATQQVVILASKVEPTKDALSDCYLQNGQLQALNILQPTKWSEDAIAEKLDAVYADFESNVTRIFTRRSMHLAIDLAYHSVLVLNVNDKLIKGWSEVLVMGDSSQGKTETALGLMRHYNLGEKVECKNATVAGLLGGLQQVGNRWFVTWGIIPAHDKRLVILEELKGAPVEIIAKLTEMRSSGVAEIPKIEKRRTHARTRLVALSNPRSDRVLSSYGFGVEAVKELIGNLEDIRRFDFTLLVSLLDVNPQQLLQLQRNPPKVPHVYSSELCQRCVLWAWTRTPDQVKFTDGARESLFKEAQALCLQFNETIPLVDSGSMQYKLARLATALACRTFSHEPKDNQLVLVRKCHVCFIDNFIRVSFASKTFGYGDYSKAMTAATTLLNADEISTRIGQAPFPSDFINQMLNATEIELRDIQDWCSWDRQDALQMLSFLVRKHALRRDGRAYRKSSSFIELLKKMNVKDRPSYIGEKSEF